MKLLRDVMQDAMVNLQRGNRDPIPFLGSLDGGVLKWRQILHTVLREGVLGTGMLWV